MEEDCLVVGFYTGRKGSKEGVRLKENILMM